MVNLPLETSVMSSRVFDSSSFAGNAGEEVQLEMSGRLVDRCLLNDQVGCDLLDKLNVKSDGPSVSGLSDSDYPSGNQFNLTDFREFVLVRRCPLPSDLMDQFSKMQSNCVMGLFPEVYRCWVAIDSDLFVWNYNSGSDLAYFDGLSHSILAVSLVPVKAGIFQSHVQFLLCVATAADIVLLAVNFTDDDGSNSQRYLEAEMHLTPEALFSVPTDGAIITDIVSTKSGRIFLTSRDGCLYEVEYQEKGWFRRSCRKVNHSKGLISYLVPSFVSQTFGEYEPLVQAVVDDSRNILFTRSENGSLQVFDLGSDGAQLNKVAGLSAQHIYHTASHWAQSIEPSNFKPLVHIAPVTSMESAQINIVGVTQRGVRFYFSCSYYGTPLHADQKFRPATLRLVHVRLPPGFTASASVPRPQNIHLAHSKGDLAVFVGAADEESDSLWSLSSANFPFTNLLVEFPITLPLRGRSWVIGESANDEWHLSNVNCSLTIVVQHTKVARQIVVMSAKGIHLFERLRPVDSLLALLREKGPESYQVANFFQMHGNDQAGAMCLIIAAAQGTDQQVFDKAVRAFFLHSNDPTLVFPSEPALDPRMMSTPLPTSFRPTNFAPNRSALNNVETMSVDRTLPGWRYGLTSGLQTQNFFGPEVKFSARHDAVHIQFSRIISTAWNAKVVVTKVDSAQKHQIRSSLRSDELAFMIEQLRRLKEFVQNHSLVAYQRIQMSSAVARDGGSINQRMLSFMRPEAATSMTNAQEQLMHKYKAEAISTERQSLQRLNDLIGRTAETLALWKTLCEHQLSVILDRLPHDLQSALKDMTFSQLIVYGKSLCADLCTCLIGQYLGDNATVDAITARLRSVCPTLYTSDDATSAKASEMLQSVSLLPDGEERTRVLQNALKLYKQVAHQLNLTSVCSQFEESLFYEGIVDVCLTAAEKLDPRELGLVYYKNRDTLGDCDTEAKKAYDKRMTCYMPIIESLNRLVGADTAQNKRLQSDQMEYYTELILKLVFGSNDELCHIATYEWLIQKRQAEKLLGVRSPYLESYLQHAIKQGGPGALQYYDLMWRFYERNRQYIQAAKLLEKLADIHSTSVDLSQRLHFLSRAIMCVKSCDPHANVGEYLQQLEDKREVAGLQMKLLESLRGLRPSAYLQEAVAKLNTELFEISPLYSDFAEEFNLPECKLAIVSSAGYHDSGLVETLWKEIIEKELAFTCDSGVTSQKSALTSKLTELSSAYGGNEVFYPSAFLIKFLLLKSFENNFDGVWLSDLFRKMGIPTLQVVETVSSIYASQDPLWGKNRKARLHLLHCCLHVLSAFTLTSGTMESLDRKRFASRCLDVVSSCLVDLQSQSSSAEILQLIRSFQDVQTKLQLLNN